MIRIGLVLACLAAVLSAACCTTTQGAKPPSVVQPQDSKLSVVTSQPSQRSVYILTGSGRFCAEPPPDIALSTLNDLSAALKLSASSGGQSGSSEAGLARNLHEDVVQLAGRSQLVLISRELLYRLCELSVNFEPGTPAFDAAARSYDRVITAVGDLASADKAAQERMLIDARIRAGELKEAAQTQATKIMTYVCRADGSADADKMKQLASGVSSLSEALKSDLVAAKSCEALGAQLRDLSQGSLDALVEAIPATGGKKPDR